jgi:hypothetical protein
VCVCVVMQALKAREKAERSSLATRAKVKK